MSRMSRRSVVVGAAASILGSPQVSVAQVPLAEWTLLIYLNGKNNLEPAALTDFYEMAEVGSSKQVNVIVQMGRPQIHHTSADEGWSGVLRFRVTKGMTPRPANALLDLGNAGLSTDMASPATLDEFVRWGIKTYPAKRTALVIWNHGQGWRFQLAVPDEIRIAGGKLARSTSEAQLLLGVPPSLPAAGGHRAVSSDDDSKSILYNRQIQDVLEKAKTDGYRLDLIGFDACLMSMLEGAHAFRRCASYFVASEELEPNNGWNYRTLLGSLNQAPSQSPATFAKTVVESYRKQYLDGDRTTLSAIDLSQVDALAQSVSALGTTLIGHLAAQRQLIEQARAGVRSFADWYSPPLQTSVDLRAFLDRLKLGNGNPEVVGKANAALQSLAKAVVANYRAAPVANDGYGGNGLAIYFPRSKQVFLDDPYHKGYLPSNAEHPLEMVTSAQTNGWAKMLLTLFQIPH